ncbi:hypothetical protein N9E39_04060 [Candidatus Pelagibacter ubique]|nr:hypothetical protein [Candidatus Pelagibacter ubique]
MIIPFNKPLYLTKYDQCIQKNLIKKKYNSSIEDNITLSPNVRIYINVLST